MDINSNLALYINIPIQFLAIVTINFFWLDYKVSKRDLITIFLFILLPAALLFILFDALAAFYLLFSLIIFLFRKYTNKLFILHILVSFILSVIVDHLASVISMNIMHIASSELLFLIVRNILFCSILAIGAYAYKKILIYLLEKYIISRKSLFLLILLIFLTLVIFYFNISTMTDKSTYESIQANLWVFNAYLLLTIPIVISIVFMSFKRYKFKHKQKEYENFSSYIQLLEQVNDDTRKFKHDYINILSSLRYYIEDQDMDGLKAYFYTNIMPAHKQETHNILILSQLNNLNVGGLKGLLTTKIIHAQEHNIPIHLEITEEISHIEMDIIELNRILGILLDNAIEASKMITDPAICIAFIALENSNVIIVQNKIHNDHDLEVHEIYREGHSTKGINRGLGLPTLKKIVNENTNIVLNTKIEATHFTQELDIKNEEVH